MFAKLKEFEFYGFLSIYTAFLLLIFEVRVNFFLSNCVIFLGENEETVSAQESSEFEEVYMMLIYFLSG